MKYQINQNNYHTFSIYEINKLPARSYFIPYPDRAKADAAAPKEKRYASEKVVCLNGEWDFKFYPRPGDPYGSQRNYPGAADETGRSAYDAGHRVNGIRQDRRTCLLAVPRLRQTLLYQHPLPVSF